MPVIAVIAPGAMGAAVGARLVEHGAQVWTVLAGRSPASAARAETAEMLGVDVRQIGAADLVLSIVPPGEAVARSHAPVIHEAARKPIYADCNAVSPQTVAAIAAEVEAAGACFVDAGIIGVFFFNVTACTEIYTSGRLWCTNQVVDVRRLLISADIGPREDVRINVLWR